MLTVIIPCFNEEERLLNSFLEVKKTLEVINITDYEIIIVDDGSTDQSFEIAKNISNLNLNTLVFQNKKNLGLGYVFFKGVKIATGNYIIYVPSDNSHKSEELSKLFSYYNKNYDFVSTFYDRKDRTFLRGIFTSSYTPFLNFLYGLKLPYYNGLTLYKSDLIKDLKIKNNSFSFQISIFVKILNLNKLNYKFVKTKLIDRKHGSSAFKIRNSLQVLYYVTINIFMSLNYRILKFFNSKKNKRDN